MVKTEVLKKLERNKGISVSGENLAKSLNVSRTAIWKAINSLKEDGFEISTIKGKGYMLSLSNNKISKEGITNHMTSSVKILMYDSVDSTNTIAMNLISKGISNNTVVIAEEQLQGKGRRGRDFYSPPNSGIYMSIILKPIMDMRNSLLITSAAAVAVTRGIKEICNVDCQIKWVNDIYLENKKISGILTEAITDFESGQIANLVIGIGINCSTENFADDLADKAGSISQSSFDRNTLIASIIDHLLYIINCLENDDKSFIDEYKSKSLVIGKPVMVFKSISLDPSCGVWAKALDIDDSGALIIKYEDGSIETLSSGEVSIRL